MKTWTWSKILLAFLFLTPSVYSKDVAKVKGINFIQEGEVSKLIIDTSSKVEVQRTHLTDDKQIILDIENVTADDKFFRGIDTSEFSGSTVYVSPYKKPGSPNGLRLAIQLRDNVRSILDNKNNRITLSIENRFGVFSKTKLDKVEENLALDLEENSRTKINVPRSSKVEDILENLTLSGIKKYVGKKISINVNKVPYPEILKMIADTSGFNIIIDDGVNQLPPLTIALTNIPWDQALDTVLGLGDLVAFKAGNILTIKTADKARQEKEKELESKKVVKRQDPLVTKIFPISFAEVASLQTILQDYLTPNRGAIQIDTRTRNLIVKDTVEVIERMRKIIETLDTETPQVLIEAKIVEASEGYEFRAGFGAGGISFGYDPLSTLDSIGEDSGTFSFRTATDIASPNIIGASVSVFKRLTNLEFSLELMESESKGRIISSPKIITQNNQAARISSTDQRQVLVTTTTQGVTTQEIRSIDATIGLNVTPSVSNDGTIALQIDLNKGGFLGTDTVGGLPNTTTKQIATNVLVENGSTIVVGGLYQTETEQIDAGVPLLKDIPVIGWLFRNSYNPKRSRNELIVFITPRVVNQEEAGLTGRDQENFEI